MVPKKHRIAFWTLVSSIDDEGIKVDRWTLLREAWASVAHRSGAQKWSSGSYAETVTDLFTIRAIPGWQPSASMTLVWNGKSYDIESVDDIREEHIDVEIRAVYRGPAEGGQV